MREFSAFITRLWGSESQYYKKINANWMPKGDILMKAINRRILIHTNLIRISVVHKSTCDVLFLTNLIQANWMVLPQQRDWKLELSRRNSQEPKYCMKAGTSKKLRIFSSRSRSRGWIDTSFNRYEQRLEIEAAWIWKDNGKCITISLPLHCFVGIKENSEVSIEAVARAKVNDT